MGLVQRTAALLGISAYQRPATFTIEPANENDIRRANGGQIQPTPYTQTRWYMSDLESAEHAADSGDLAMAARLMTAARRDGILSGVLSTRTAGLVRLPKRFRGSKDQVKLLELGHDETRSIFDEMLPANELAQFAADGVLLGVAIGELVPVKGRSYPVFVRLNPEFLTYRWNENRWYYRSIVGLIPVTPGDGRWVLHTPGGRLQPWQNGLWRAVGRAYIRKDHAAMYKDNWEAKLANPARIAVAPQGGTEAQKQSWFQAVMAWGVNTVFGMTPGYDVKLLESNGRGYDSFVKTISEQNDEFKMAIAGQTVTSDGGAGFQNSDIHKSIRADLIKATADDLAYTINTQVLPAWVFDNFGEDGLDEQATVYWDVTPPKDRNGEATSLQTAGNAIKGIAEALASYDLALDIETVCAQFGIPLMRKGEGVVVQLVQPEAPPKKETEAA